MVPRFDKVGVMGLWLVAGDVENLADLKPGCLIPVLDVR